MDMTSSASVTSGSGSGGGAWLRAHHDPYASLYALPGGLCTADVLADGDQRLLVADLRNGGRLRLFRGGRQQQQGEQALAALPCGLAAFRTESAPPGQPPSVAVAAGSCLYVYRNLRPFYKFSLPHTAADEEEKEAWSKQQDPDALREALETLRSQGGMGRLTARSQRFLLLEPEEAKAFVEANWEFPLKRQTQVPGAVCCLDAQGAFDVDFHVALATRDDRLHLVKRGHKASRVLAEPGAPAVGLCHLEPGQLVAACADRRLRAYSLKGQCVWSVSLGAQPLAVAAVCSPGVCQAAAVALSDRRVVLHGAADGAPTHVLNTRDAVSAIHFGRLGREDNALVMVGTGVSESLTAAGGSLTVLILRRNAQLLLSPSSSSREAPGAVGGPRWSLPKKTKLFVDQTMREREHSVAMHRGFLRDLQRLRLTAARHYHRAVLGAAAPARATDDTGAAGPVLVELSAQVQGLGPRLAVHVRLQSSRPLNRLTMVVHGDDQYRLQKPATQIIVALARVFFTTPQVAYLVPGLAYRYTAMVTAESGAAGVLKVVVARQTRVLATALVQMPALDMP
ncbi:hypothetical protein HPB52_013662 [Rhipicephalus sanguineus]|uniref:Bardet-Biedl syndrome 1 N-terminal domain-containing protein n=1 Tax=Rhipicephalus sanguineus TaxID=34632 RepID=A0A9D4PH10_RHISA|nr:hypothetical protein HPB52_013662 [Rhipicephalus sanguineus]